MKTFREFEDAKSYLLRMLEDRIKNLENHIQFRSKFGEHKFLHEAEGKLEAFKEIQRIVLNTGTSIYDKNKG